MVQLGFLEHLHLSDDHIVEGVDELASLVDGFRGGVSQHPAGEFGHSVGAGFFL